uniref:Uncharacterized protein n=1 Tax=Ananas comosus var. bracteatus TaxID=296719 RepID=A0A6V7NFM6_ANACO|nr:unnamed protein product [Ananas comosus var. bracteatus]
MGNASTKDEGGNGAAAPPQPQRRSGGGTSPPASPRPSPSPSPTPFLFVPQLRAPSAWQAHDDRASWLVMVCWLGISMIACHDAGMQATSHVCHMPIMESVLFVACSGMELNRAG